MQIHSSLELISSIIFSGQSSAQRKRKEKKAKKRPKEPDHSKGGRDVKDSSPHRSSRTINIPLAFLLLYPPNLYSYYLLYEYEYQVDNYLPNQNRDICHLE